MVRWVAATGLWPLRSISHPPPNVATERKRKHEARMRGENPTKRRPGRSLMTIGLATSHLAQHMNPDGRGRWSYESLPISPGFLFGSPLSPVKVGHPMVTSPIPKSKVAQQGFIPNGRLCRLVAQHSLALVTRHSSAFTRGSTKSTQVQSLSLPKSTKKSFRCNPRHEERERN